MRVLSWFISLSFWSTTRLGSWEFGSTLVVGWTMKWSTLLKDIKEKVGLAQSSSDSTTADAFPVDLTAPSSSSPSTTYAGDSSRYDFNSSPSRYPLYSSGSCLIWLWSPMLCSVTSLDLLYQSDQASTKWILSF